MSKVKGYKSILDPDGDDHSETHAVEGFASVGDIGKNGDAFAQGVAVSDALLKQYSEAMALSLSHQQEDWILNGGRAGTKSRQIHKVCRHCRVGKKCHMCNDRGWYRV